MKTGVFIERVLHASAHLPVARGAPAGAGLVTQEEGRVNAHYIVFFLLLFPLLRTLGRTCLNKHVMHQADPNLRIRVEYRIVAIIAKNRACVMLVCVPMVCGDLRGGGG